MRKTGSSALQEIFAKSRKDLAGLGIDYPETLCGFPAHQELAWMFYRNDWMKEAGKTRAEIVEHYRTIIEKNIARDVQTLVSSEDLSLLSLNAAALRDLWRVFHDYNPRVVFYHRSPLDYHVSNFVHGVMAGREKRSFREYVFQARNLSFATRFIHADTWGSIFGSDNVQILKYDMDRFAKKSIFADFIESVFNKSVEDNYIEYRSNIGASYDTVEYCLALNRSDISDEEIAPIKNKLRRLPLPKPEQDFLEKSLTPTELQILKEIYSA
nr:sulfotransferase domain-containing protein [Halovulum dunhuangense]